MIALLERVKKFGLANGIFSLSQSVLYFDYDGLLSKVSAKAIGSVVLANSSEPERIKHSSEKADKKRPAPSGSRPFGL